MSRSPSERLERIREALDFVTGANSADAEWAVEAMLTEYARVTTVLAEHARKVLVAEQDAPR